MFYDPVEERRQRRSYQRSAEAKRAELAIELERTTLSFARSNYINTTTEGLLCAAAKALREQKS